MQQLAEAARAVFGAAVDVDNVADCLKGVERNAERQRAEGFIRGQHRKVDRDAGGQHGFPSFFPREQEDTGKIVQHAGGKQQRKMAQVAKGIENQTCRDEQRVFCAHGPQQVICRQHQRQKRKQKDGGRKIHCRSLLKLAPPQRGGACRLFREVIAEAAVDAAAVVRHTERIDLALTELVQIRLFQLYVVQICPVGLVDHRPGMVVVRARFMPRDDIA